MSVDLMSRIWWREDLGTMEKFVALAIADGGYDDGSCYASIDRLAKKCSCVRRTIQAALRSLEGKGLLRTYHRRDRVNAFQLVLENLPHVEKPPYSEKESKFSAAEERMHRQEQDERDLLSGLKSTRAANAPVQQMHGEGGAFNDADPVHLTTRRGAANAPSTLDSTLEQDTSDSGDFKSPDVSPLKLSRWVGEEWHRLKADHPGVADVRVVDENLDRMIQLRGKQQAREGEDGFAVWVAAFQEIRASAFLQGRAPPSGGRDNPFKLSLGWLCKPTNFREVINGKYRDNPRRRTSSGDPLGRAAAEAADALERRLRRKSG